MEKNNQLALSIAETLKYDGPAAAEKKMLAVANSGGDASLAIAVAKLSPAQIVEIAGDFDYTRVSLVFSLSTPEQVCAVFRRIGLGWNEITEDLYRMTELQEEMRQFFWAYVLLRDEKEGRQEVLAKLVEEPNGIDAIVFASNHLKDYDALVASGGKTMNNDFEIVRVLEILLPEAFEDFVEAAKEVIGHLNVFNAQFADSAYRIALTETGHKEEEMAAEDDIFTPLS